MAKKSPPSKADRSDPKKNKSLAIRNIMAKLPSAKAAEIVAAVKKEFGHIVSANRVYMVKAKGNMRKDGRPRRKSGTNNGMPLVDAATWVSAIKTARQLLKETGSVANATALLKAIDA